MFATWLCAAGVRLSAATTATILCPSFPHPQARTGTSKNTRKIMRIAEGIVCSISIHTKFTSGLRAHLRIVSLPLQSALSDFAMTAVTIFCLLQVASLTAREREPCGVLWCCSGDRRPCGLGFSNFMVNRCCLVFDLLVHIGRIVFTVKGAASALTYRTSEALGSLVPVLAHKSRWGRAPRLYTLCQRGELSNLRAAA
jgi:hypothetical protein